MRIACPSCAAAYVVPDSLLTAGRVVRCVRCGGEWVPVAAAPEPEPEEPPPVERQPAPTEAVSPPLQPVVTARPSAMARLAAHPAWPEPSIRLRLAWAGSLALLILAIGAAFTWHEQIAAAWPPSARAYAVFGL